MRRNINRNWSGWPRSGRRMRPVNAATASLIPNTPNELLGVYGFFRLAGLLEKPRKVWFEIGEDELLGRKAQVTVVSGLEICTEPETRLRRLNRHLRKKAHRRLVRGQASGRHQARPGTCRPCSRFTSCACAGPAAA